MFHSLMKVSEVVYAMLHFFLWLDVPQGPTTEVLNRAKNVPIAHIEQVKAAFASRPIMSRAYLESKLVDSSVISNLKV